MFKHVKDSMLAVFMVMWGGLSICATFGFAWADGWTWWESALAIVGTIVNLGLYVGVNEYIWTRPRVPFQ